MRRKTLLMVSVPAMMAANCHKAPADDAVVEAPSVGATVGTPEAPSGSAPVGLDLTLSEGTPGAGATDAPPVPATTTLAGSVIDAILRRLPALDMAPRAAFAVRPGSKPPPIAGQTVDVSFPPDTAPDAPVTNPGPLHVLRWAPEGDVPLASHVSVTFDQPVIPLTTQDAASLLVPAVLDPQPPGKWRWVGTRTLLFEPDLRMPMATTYTLRVPAGTKTANGTTLDTAFEQHFSTPPVRLVGHTPTNDPTPLRPVIALTFDQRVDDAAIAAAAQITANGKPVAVHVATTLEIAADPVARHLAESTKPDLFVALVPDADLPNAARVDVTLPEGTPSAEGPLKTTGAQSFSFHTFGPLKFAESRCGWDTPCRPGWPLYVRFTNPLDPDIDLDKLVTVEPKAEGGTLAIEGDAVVLYGGTQANTTYSVTVGAGVRDVFGQTLTEAVRASFSVGAAEPAWPSLWASGDPQIPDPYAPPRAVFVAQGMSKVHVRVAKVTAKDWSAYVEPERENYQEPPPLPGTVVLDQVRTISGDTNAPSLFEVDLSTLANGGVGQFVVELSSPTGTPRDRRQFTRAWVNATHLGLAAWVDAKDALVQVTDLSTGRPVPGAAVALGGKVVGTSDKDGLVAFASPPDTHKAPLLTATLGADEALMTASGGPSIWGAWSPGGRGVEGAFFVFDDRALYRPSETAHLKGWLREIDFGKGGGLRAPPVAGQKDVSWVLTDAQGVEIGRGTTPIDGLGGFAFDIKLPGTPNLGPANLELSTGTYATHHSFDIREFRRPEFEVSASVEDAGPFVIGTDAIAAVHASYYAGGALPSAPVTWNVSAVPSSWTPPGWDDGWRFGAYEPPWWGRGWFDEGRRFGEPTPSWSFEGKTDSSGTHRVKMDFLRVSPPRATSVVATATVMDVNRQAWTSTTTLLVHPASIYVGVKTDVNYVEVGKPITAELVAVSLDGEATAGVALHAALVHEKMIWRRGQWTTEEDARLLCELTSAATPSRCTFTPDKGGSWKLIVTAVDGASHPTETSTQVWVSGGDTWPTVAGVEQEKVTIIPDKETYAVGDIARLLIAAPFAPADAVITWRRSGVVHSETRHLDGTSATLEVPIDEAFTPNLQVQVDLTGANKRSVPGGKAAADAPLRPAYASGEITLSIPPIKHGLTVTVTPAARGVDPGAKTTIDVEVRDANGALVPGAQVALVMVDESVLALTGYSIPSPIETFFPTRDPGVEDHQQRGWVLLADLAKPSTSGGQANGGAMADGEETTAVRGGIMRKSERVTSAMPSMAMMDEARPIMPPPAPEPGNAPSTPIAMRSDFRADALWAPAITTDSRGHATVPVTLPDSLTRYRITAVAVDPGTSFGIGTADVTARLPVMLRPSAPRFLNFGDHAELPLVVQNQTDKAMTVDVAVRADNATVDGADKAGRRAVVPANDRIEIRVPIATIDAGRAHFQAAVVSGNYADSASFDFPVWTPATSEAFAVYGSLDGPAGLAALKQPVDLPGDVWPQFGGLEITTSSTALQALTDSFLYLIDYPYGCAEQIASRVLSIAALKDVLQAFDVAGMPSEAEIKKSVGLDLAELKRRQNNDGSFGWWVRDTRGEPMVTLHVTHALVRAKAAGFEVDPIVLSRALDRVHHIDGMFDRWWSEDSRRVARAYAIRVRQLAGEDTVADARKLYADGGGTKLPLEALGWILPSLAKGKGTEPAEIVTHLHNRVTETAATAQFVERYAEVDDALLLHGDRRTDGILLEAMLEVFPTDDVLPKIVTGLLDGRVAGRWSSTQDNAWVLMALKRYFEVAEKVTPDFVAQVWLGSGYAGEHTFKGRTTERARIDVPMAWIAGAKGDDDLTVARQGAGRMYYRLGLSYAPKSLDLKPAEAGFSVTRGYEAVDAPSDVTRDASGTWHVKAGARVRVTVTMAVPARRYHVALVDPMPAGFEVLDPALKVNGDMPIDAPDTSDPWAKVGWWWGPWYDHQNLRDERVEAFATTVWEGVHTERYVVRATTLGSFIVPPAKAEEMYHPETFGRSGTDRVVVE